MSCSSRSLLLCTIWLIANGAAGALGMRAVVGRQRLGDLGSHSSSCDGGPRVERRHRADDARLALRDHQLRVADDEQRRADDGQRAGCCRTAGSWTWTVVLDDAAMRLQNASSASAVHALGAFDDRVAQARRACAGCGRRRSARWRSWRVMNAASLALPRAGPRRPAARAPSASRRPRCRPASGTAREPANAAFGVGLRVARRRSRRRRRSASRAAGRRAGASRARRRCRAAPARASVSLDLRARSPCARRAAVARRLAADQVVGLDRRSCLRRSSGCARRGSTAPRRSPR